MIYAAKNQVIGAYFGNKKVLKMYLGDVQVYASKVPVIVTIDGVETTTTMGSGEPLSITLSPSIGRQIMPWTVIVTMDDVDITATAYDKTTNTVSIASLEAAVEITAESVEMSADYKPVEYISVVSKASGNGLNTGYRPSSNTKLVMDVEMKSGSPNLLYGNRYTNSSEKPYFYVMYQVTSNVNTYVIGWGNYSTGTATTAAGRIKKDARVLFTCDKGRFIYPNTSGGTRDISYASEGGTWEAQETHPTLKIFGYSTSSSTGTGTGKIYRVTIYENDVLQKDLIPCIKVEDGNAGLYDIVSATYIKATNYTAAS